MKHERVSVSEKNKITSPANPGVKEIVRLRGDPQERQKKGLTIVEGWREVTRAWEAKVRFKGIYVCPDLWRERDAAGFPKPASFGAPVYETTGVVFSKMAYGERGEGILAVCEAPVLSFADLRPARSLPAGGRKNPLFVVVEGLEKPGNLGAILRTCDAAKVDAVIVCGGRTDIYNPNVIRASLGTVFSVPVVSGSMEEALKFLKSQNAKICAALPQTEILYTQVDFQVSSAIVVGSEQDGLSEFWRRQADVRMRIPMAGAADSLNVSASTAILVYEALRQRGGVS